MNQDGKKLIDTNILVYSVNSGADDFKRDKAKQIMKKGFNGEEKFYIAVQSLEEFITVSTSAIQDPITFNQAKEYLQTIVEVPEFVILNTSSQNVLKAAEIMEKDGKDYWDSLIASVAQTNNVNKILTENTKDFQKITGIKAENPFK